MAQQKKRNVAAISYSSLHEKLGEASRTIRSLEAEVKALKTGYNVKIKQLHELNIAHTDLRLKHNGIKVAVGIPLATSIVLNIALLLFTIY